MRPARLAVAVVGIGVPLIVGIQLYERSAHAQPPQDVVVRAQRFELVDATGQVRATLAVGGPSGEVDLKLLDAKGMIRAKLGGDRGGSGLVLYNETSEPGVHILATRTRTFVVIQRGDRRRVLRP
jgi:hypothetical protein